MTIKTATRLVALLLTVSCAGGVMAEDVEKRWRVGLNVGGYDARDGVTSDSANFLSITDADDITQDQFVDPRNDAAAQGTLSIKPAIVGSLTAQYAATKIFLVEFSVGYYENDLGDVEVQAQFDGQPNDPNAISPFQFNIYNINAGTLTQVPLQGTAIWRFRPRANLNPFVGVGLGYVFVGYEPSGEFNQLSQNIDDSVGSFARLQTFPGGFVTGGPATALTGATVEAEDTFEYHVKGGLEYSVGKNWSMVFDLGWMFSSKSVRLQFSGVDQLGISVPQKRVYQDDPLADGTFGSIQVTQGGFIDGGQLVPNDPDAGTNCSTDPLNCTFIVGDYDGVPDPGFYYVRGGEIRYDAVTVMLGFRYTF